MPFTKGQSGNPKGRPRLGAALAPALRTVLKQRGPDGRTNRELLAEQVFNTAMAGNVAAMSLIFERIDGKVPDQLNLTGANGGPVQVRQSFDWEAYNRLYAQHDGGLLPEASE